MTVHYDAEIGNDEEVNLERVQRPQVLRQKMFVILNVSDNQDPSIMDPYAKGVLKGKHRNETMQDQKDYTPQMHYNTSGARSGPDNHCPFWDEILKWLDQEENDGYNTAMNEKYTGADLHHDSLSRPLAAHAAACSECSRRLNSYSAGDVHGERSDCPDIDALRMHLNGPGNPVLATHLEQCSPCRSEFQILKETAWIASRIIRNSDNPDYIFSDLCYELDKNMSDTGIDDKEGIDDGHFGTPMQAVDDSLYADVDGAKTRDADIHGHMNANAKNQSSQPAELTETCMTT